jgi:T5SS/PEP-CTERM-associated repeat protein
VSVGGNLNIGRNATRQTAAGDGTLRVNGSGRVNVTGVINVGNDPDGGAGRFVLDGVGALVTCAGVNASGLAPLQLLDGELRVVGGVVDTGSEILDVGRGSLGDEATLTLRGGTVVTDGPIAVGVVGDGVLRVESGSRVDFQDSDLDLGVNPAVAGLAVVSGTGSLVDVRAINIGTLGSGSLTVESGGRVVAQRDIQAGSRGGSQGAIMVQDGRLEGGEDLLIGGREENGVLLTGGPSSLVVGGQGVVTLAGNLYRFGNSSFSLQGGVINAAEFHTAVINFASAVEARGTINAKIRGFAPIRATGPLTIGVVTQDSIANLRVEVGPHRVTCLSLINVADLVSVTIAGGVLESESGMQLESGGTITGHGRLENSVRSAGAITSSGGTLVFADGLNSEFGTMTGERFEFPAGTTFLGRAGGTRWRAHPGTTMVFRHPGGGAINLGGNVNDAFECEGEWYILSDTFIGDLDGIEVGPRCTLLGARLAVGTSTPGSLSDVRVASRGGVRDSFCGTGEVLARNVLSKGILSPGIDGGAGVGAIAMSGHYTQALDGEAGVLVLDVAGATPSEADLLEASGVVTLDGTVTIRVSARFRPANGFRRVVVRGASIVGGIDRVEIPPGWSLDRSAATLDAVFCAPDFNSDGFVDFFDYDDFTRCFEGELCAPGALADFNGDGFVDFFDYDDFVSAFEAGC